VVKFPTELAGCQGNGEAPDHEIAQEFPAKRVLDRKGRGSNTCELVKMTNPWAGLRQVERLVSLRTFRTLPRLSGTDR
jgi:hypothetical protein